MGPIKGGKRARRDEDGGGGEAHAAPAAIAIAADDHQQQPPPLDGHNQKMKKNKKNNHQQPSSKGSAYWSSLGGWKPIAVSDQELFLGADEGGFGGLEELDASAVDSTKLAELDAQAKAMFGGKQDGAAVVGPATSSAKGGKKDDRAPKKQKKEKKQQREAEASAGGRNGAPTDPSDPAAKPLSRKERRAAERRAYKQEQLKRRAEERRARRAEARAACESGGEVGGGDVAALKARLAALERENARLKEQRGLEGSDEPEQEEDDEQQEEEDDEDGSGSEDDDPDTTLLATTTTPSNPIDTLAWRAAFGGADWLHPRLEQALALAGFAVPTAVQSATLAGASRDRRDVICAAQTGSGKTLAFGLPILQRLLEERDREEEQRQQQEEEDDEMEEDDEASDDDDDAKRTRAANTQNNNKQLRALILAPTRELGLQVAAHLSALAKPLGIGVAALVGGLALPKQERMLARSPEIVVGTPGRLWDLMRRAHPHVSDLSGLSFLVIDEADRMVQRGHYAELSAILDLVPRGAGDGGNGRGSDAGGGASNGKSRLEDEEVPELPADAAALLADPNSVAAPEEDAPSNHHAAPQTMVFSATLTLPASLRKRLRKGGGGQSGAATLDALMDRVPFRGARSGGGRGPLIVDLTTTRRLADRVHEAHARCSTDARRDAALALFLSSHPGRCVVFVNAVSSLRRLAALLRLLGLPAQALHAQQQQRQRLKALDRFRTSEDGVLVATDVAARGLDVKGVESVVHYQLPASADTYIHRCGRTARTGGGEGVSLALVTPKEAARWRALRFALAAQQQGEGGGDGNDEEPAPCPEFPLDGALLREAERRLGLAEKVDALERAARKKRAERSWARSQAAAAGLALSDDDEDGGGDDGEGDDDEEGGGGSANLSLSPRDAAELARLRSQLAAAVAVPLQPRVSRKFFAGGGSADLLLRLGGEGEGVEGGGSARGADVAQAAEAVDLAARLAKQQQKKQPPQADAAPLSKREQERLRREAERRRQAKVDRLLLSNNERKRQRRAVAQGTGRGMVVIGRPGVGGSSAVAMAAVASGRPVSGGGAVTALAALRGGGSR